MNVEELASDMGEAGHFLDPATTIKILEPSIAIGMQPACKVFEMISWPAAPAIQCEAVERCRMVVASSISFISEIDPQPSGLRLASSRRQDVDWCIISVDGSAPDNMTPYGIGKGCKQRCRVCDPISECRAVEMNAFTLIDLGLRIEREMIGVLADKYMRQKTRPRTPAFDRHHGR